MKRITTIDTLEHAILILMDAALADDIVAIEEDKIEACISDLREIISDIKRSPMSEKAITLRIAEKGETK